MYIEEGSVPWYMQAVAEIQKPQFLNSISILKVLTAPSANIQFPYGDE